MKIVERYVLREFIRYFYLSLIFFIALVIVVRLGEKDIGDFASGNMSFSEALKSILYKIPDRIMQVIPASVIMGAFFSLGKFSQNNELTAMKAVGINMTQIMIPIFVCSALVCMLSMVFNDQVVSQANRKAYEIQQKISRSLYNNMIFKLGDNRSLYVHTLDPSSGRIDGITIYEYKNQNEIASEIFAKSAQWKGGSWILTNAVYYTFDSHKKTIENYPTLKLDLGLDPIALAESTKKPSEMTFFNLRKRIENMRKSGRAVRAELVEIHHRISYPLASLVVVIIAVPFAIRFGGIGVSGIAVGFLFTLFLLFLYWGIAIATFEALGKAGKLPPLMACWSANLLFAALGLGLIKTTPR